MMPHLEQHRHREPLDLDIDKPAAKGKKGSHDTVNSGQDIATTASSCGGVRGGDTAVLYYFGDNSPSAITIPAGATRTVSASLFLTPPQPTVTINPAPAMNTASLALLMLLLSGAGRWMVRRHPR